MHPALRHSRRLPAVVLACTAMLALASCGGSDPDLTLAQPAPYTASFQEPAASTSEYDRHRAMATANAGSDPFFAGELRKQWCWSAENTGFPPELANTTVVPATRLFDDLHFTGLRWVGQYVLKTSTGIFLLDTLNNAGEVQSITLPGLTAMGYTPQQIVGALPTHGHGDSRTGQLAVVGEPVAHLLDEVVVRLAELVGRQRPAGLRVVVEQVPELADLSGCRLGRALGQPAVEVEIHLVRRVVLQL